MESKYLAHLRKLMWDWEVFEGETYDCSEHGVEPEWEKVMDFLEWDELHTLPDLVQQHKEEEFFTVEVFEPGDGVWCIFDKGELKLTGYISTRGSLYQAGAFDGEKQYGSSNLGFHEGPGYICANIAKEGWETVTGLLAADDPAQFLKEIHEKEEREWEEQKDKPRPPLDPEFADKMKEAAKPGGVLDRIYGKDR